MKKFLLILGMVTTILGLSACGQQQNDSDDVSTALITEDQAISYADNLIDQINMIVSNKMEDQVASDQVASAAVASWSKALGEMGEYKKVTDHKVDIKEDSVTIVAGVEGSTRNASVEIIMEKDATGQLALTSIATNVNYTFAELMEKAAMNTVIGMATVFAVLILISLLIRAFVLIPKVQRLFAKKPEEKKTEEIVEAKEVESAPEVVADEEDLTDDLELVAVIAAAIAASEGAATTDGFVVRSIKRANTRKWQNA